MKVIEGREGRERIYLLRVLFSESRLEIRVGFFVLRRFLFRRWRFDMGYEIVVYFLVLLKCCFSIVGCKVGRGFYFFIWERR